MHRRRHHAVPALALLAVAITIGPVGGPTATARTAAVPTPCPVNPDGSAVRGDLTGDGRGHLVVGLPLRNQIQDTLGDGSRWHLTEGSTNLRTGVDPAVGFGSAVLLANINGDRCVDLVVGAPGTGSTAKSRGAVDILLMTPTLPELTTAARIDGPQAGSRFGAALAVTRHGSVVDLWVGAPGYSTPTVAEAGAVLRYTIGPSGVPALTQIITLDHPVAGDHFGAVLDSGTGLTSSADPAKKDAFVMVGTPDRTVDGPGTGPQAGAGEVQWIRSLATTGAGSIMAVLSEATPSTTTAERGDHFGFSISAGDVGQPTLIGVPGEDLRTTVDAGLVARTAVAADGTVAHITTFDQSRADVPGSAEAGDQFGYSVTLNPTAPSGDGGILAFVGAPGEDIGSVRDAGEVQRFWMYANPSVGSTDVPPLLYQGNGGLRDLVEAGDRVGATLSMRLAAADGTLGPVVGVPGESGATSAAAGIAEYSTNRNGDNVWRLTGYYAGAVSGLHYGAVLARLA